MKEHRKLVERLWWVGWADGTTWIKKGMHASKVSSSAYQIYHCARHDCGCILQLKVVYYQDGNTAIHQAHQHCHTGPFTGRGLHPVHRSKINEHISTNTTAPKVLLDGLRDAKLIIPPNMPEPTLLQVIHTPFSAESDIIRGY